MKSPTVGAPAITTGSSASPATDTGGKVVINPNSRAVSSSTVSPANRSACSPKSTPNSSSGSRCSPTRPRRVPGAIPESVATATSSAAAAVAWAPLVPTQTVTGTELSRMCRAKVTRRSSLTTAPELLSCRTTARVSASWAPAMELSMKSANTGSMSPVTFTTST